MTSFPRSLALFQSWQQRLTRVADRAGQLGLKVYARSTRALHVEHLEMLRSSRAFATCCRAWHQAQTDPTLYAADQQQG